MQKWNGDEHRSQLTINKRQKKNKRETKEKHLPSRGHPKLSSDELFRSWETLIYERAF
jgi:hypothetical protein